MVRVSYVVILTARPSIQFNACCGCKDMRTIKSDGEFWKHCFHSFLNTRYKLQMIDRSKCPAKNVFQYNCKLIYMNTKLRCNSLDLLTYTYTRDIYRQVFSFYNITMVWALRTLTLKWSIMQVY